MINNTSKRSYKAVLLGLSVSLFSTIGYSAESAQSSIATISEDDIRTAPQPLPNAYELVKKIDNQKLEIARLSGQIEKLELELIDMKRFLDSELKELIKTELNAALSAQSKQNALASAATQPPYLAPSLSDSTGVTNKTKTKSNDSKVPEQELTATDNESSSPTSSENPLTKPSAKQQGAFAYAAAHYAFKNDGSDIGIQKMQDFISTYPKHNLIPNAHYWLGEFYLKQTPPNTSLAKKQFEKVVQDYKDHPENDMRSKALYRLAIMAKDNNQTTQAKQYADMLIKNHPDSSEAKLAENIKW